MSIQAGQIDTNKSQPSFTMPPITSVSSDAGHGKTCLISIALRCITMLQCHQPLVEYRGSYVCVCVCCARFLTAIVGRVPTTERRTLPASYHLPTIHLLHGETRWCSLLDSYTV